MSTGISSDQRDYAHGRHGVLFFMILAHTLMLSKVVQQTVVEPLLLAVL